MRIVIESGTGSEWVAQLPEGFGHCVIVVDPNFAPMYGDRGAQSKRTGAMRRRSPRRVGMGSIAPRIALPGPRRCVGNSCASGRS